MNLELLPNEIILDLFDYFDGIDLLRAFYDLNYRFNFLLYKQFRFYCFKFESVSKHNFDMICQQHLPFIANRVITLHLSNAGETPEQINLFYSYILSFNQFTQLRSLELSNLNSYQTLLKLLSECHHLNKLTHLKLHCCSFQNDQVDLQSIVDNIWSLPKLTDCDLSIYIEGRWTFCVPTIISSSLKCITIFTRQLEINEIIRLFEYTPRLKRLLGCVLSPNKDNYIATPLTTLIQLNISFDSSDISTLLVFLQNIPNLCHLDMNIYTELIDGHQWKQIIRNYLPKLKTFQLKLKTRIFDEPNLEKRIDELMNSFRSSFWINEHRWFVRCFTWHGLIHLYTLSHPLDSHFESIDETCKLTCPLEDYLKVFNNTTTINNETFFNQLIPSHIRLPNIEYLHIKLPINDAFSTIVPSLNRLHLLTVSSYADNYQSQLQNLLNRASHLHSLTIRQDTSLPLQLSLFKFTNASVRKLNLGYYNPCFNKEECIALTRAPLCVQCEVLFIRVNNPESIINLVKNMINLRSLYVYWSDKNNSKRSSLSNNNDESSDGNSLSKDELIQWLKVRLPLTYLIVKDTKNFNHILIWI